MEERDLQRLFEDEGEMTIIDALKISHEECDHVKYCVDCDRYYCTDCGCWCMRGELKNSKLFLVHADLALPEHPKLKEGQRLRVIIEVIE